jgi:S-adenosylmethionine decarboxylase
MQSLSNAEVEHASLTHEAKGTHLLLTLRQCSGDLLNDQTKLGELARAAAEATGATILETFTHAFVPQGTTIVLVLAESHASLHTYPESGIVFWDCFTCGTKCQPELSVELLVTELKPGSIDKQIVYRA